MLLLLVMMVPESRLLEDALDFLLTHARYRQRLDRQIVACLTLLVRSFSSEVAPRLLYSKQMRRAIET